MHADRFIGGEYAIYDCIGVLSLQNNHMIFGYLVDFHRVISANTALYKYSFWAVLLLILICKVVFSFPLYGFKL